MTKSAPEYTVNLTPRPDMAVMHHVFAAAARGFFGWYGKCKVVGLENVPASGAVIFAANHASNIDPVLGWATLRVKRKMWGVAKVELWQNPLTRYFMNCIGAIPVKRGTADRAMIRAVLDLLAKGEAVGLFPEGTRSPNGELQAPQAGIGLLVQKSGAPVVPVGISGTYEMMPVGQNKLKRAGLTVAFGKPLTFPADMPRNEIAARIMEAIQELLKESRWVDE